MQQVLFWIPIKFSWFPDGIPVHGFGVMLFLAFVVCIVLVARWAKREGVSADRIYDLALWVFFFGIVGARIVFVIHFNRPWQDFFKIWEGGIEFYGSAIGGWIGYALGYLYLTRVKKEKIDTWKMADIVAPAVCLGLLIGRVGCLLNGCCFGGICTVAQPCITFPMMTSPARELVVDQGYQTMAGFSLDPKVFDVALLGKAPALVGTVEPGSPAANAGLKAGDSIVQVNEFPVTTYNDLPRIFQADWPRGITGITLKVQRGAEEIVLPAFTPRTLPLHPTQIYESISMFLLLLVLLAFQPFRRHYGQTFVLLMVGYAFHRFINESLRNDTKPVLGTNMTISQVGSILVLLAAVGLELYLRRYSRKIEATGSPSSPAVAASKA